MMDPSTSERGDDARAGRGAVVTAHIGLLISTLFALFAVVKVLSVSRYDSTTALALLGSSSTAAIILGTLASTIRPVLIATVAAVIAAVDRDIGSWEDRMVLTLFGYVSCFLLALVSLPFGVAMLGLLILACHSWPGKLILKLNKEVRQYEARQQARRESLERLKEGVKASSGEEQARLVQEALLLAQEGMAESSRRLKQMTPARERTKRILLMFAAGLFFVSLVTVSTDRPWLPAETIQQRGEAPTIGYVVKEDERGLVVLREQDRTIVDMPSGSVTKRSLCRLTTPSSASAPLHRVLGQSIPSYELCSDLVDSLS